VKRISRASNSCFRTGQHTHPRFSAGQAKVACPTALIFIIVGLSIVSCNPFSPAIDYSLSQEVVSADSIGGFFEIFRESYQLQDTVIYGKLLAPDFIFSYRDYDRGLDLEWGRDEDMQTTGALFAASQSLDLLWGDVLDSTGNDTVYDITRAFSLVVTFNPDNILQVDGRAIFTLDRPTKNDPWQAIRWRDESNF